MSTNLSSIDYRVYKEWLDNDQGVASQNTRESGMFWIVSYATSPNKLFHMLLENLSLLTCERKM